MHPGTRSHAGWLLLPTQLLLGLRLRLCLSWGTKMDYQLLRIFLFFFLIQAQNFKFCFCWNALRLRTPLEL